MKHTTHAYTRQTEGTWAENGVPISLGHQATNSANPTNLAPATAGLAVTADGSKVVVANLFNDLVSIVDPKARKVISELDLRPGKIDPDNTGVPGGEYPYAIAIKGNEVAYISSLRDRELVAVSLGEQPTVMTRITVKGSPSALLLNRQQTRLFATADLEDVVNVIDTASDVLVKTIKTTGPDYLLRRFRHYKGSSPNSLALAPDGSTLYVTNAGTNSLAVIDLCQERVVGLIPTPLLAEVLQLSSREVIRWPDVARPLDCWSVQMASI